MVLQIRPKDGDQRWYDPDRDLIYSLPRVIKTVLNTFEPSAQNIEFAHHLGALFVHCRACDVSLDEVKTMTAALKKHYPAQYKVLVEEAFMVLMGEMRWGCGNVTSKGAADSVVNLYGLDQVGAAMLAKPKHWWQIWRKA